MSHSYVLEQVDIFEDLSPSQLDLVEKICQERNFNQGEVVFEENSPSREFYVITDGEVEIQIDPDTIGDGTDAHEPTTIAVLRRGQSFGEVAIIDPGVRSASARSRCRSAIRLKPFASFIACPLQATRSFKLKMAVTMEITMTAMKPASRMVNTGTKAAISRSMVVLTSRS